MKSCSKCQRELPETEFVKSPRYLDGLYPSCKECRKASRVAYLARNPLCLRCKKEPHTATNVYCLECTRLISGGNPIRQRHHPKDKMTCPKCGGPRKTPRRWCTKCATKAGIKWMKSRGGQWAYYTNKGQRYKLIARAHVNRRVQNGKLIPLPCEVCGRLEVEAHHDDHTKPLEIRWLCAEHHDALERWIAMKKKQLANLEAQA